MGVIFASLQFLCSSFLVPRSLGFIKNNDSFWWWHPVVPVSLFEYVDALYPNVSGSLLATRLVRPFRVFWSSVRAACNTSTRGPFPDRNARQESACFAISGSWTNSKPCQCFPRTRHSSDEARNFLAPSFSIFDDRSECIHRIREVLCSHVGGGDSSHFHVGKHCSCSFENCWDGVVLSQIPRSYIQLILAAKVLIDLCQQSGKVNLSYKLCCLNLARTTKRASASTVR